MSLKPVYLIVGSDRPKVDLAVRRLRGRFEAGAVEQLDAERMSGEDAVAACNSLGLLGGGARLVLVEHVERWKADDVKPIAAYLAAPAPETVLALVAESLRRDSPLSKVCGGAGEVLQYDVVKKRLAEWVAGQFKTVGASAEPDACRALVALVGEDLYALQTEVEKLAAWAGDDLVTEADVERLVVPFAEEPPWTLTDAWGRKDVAAVLASAEDALERSGEPRSTTLPRLAGSIGAHVRLVRACQRFEAEGVSPRAAAARLRKKPFPVEKAFRQARSFSVEELRSAVVRVAELDRALKGGSRLPGELELQRALVEITGRASGAA